MPHNPRLMNDARKRQTTVHLEDCVRIRASIACLIWQWSCYFCVVAFGPMLLGQDPAVQLASATSVSKVASVPSTASASSGAMASRWPYQERVGQFHVHSTVPIAKLEMHLLYLSTLPKELSTSLAISISEQPIHLVVLESRESLDSYVNRLLPDAPSRRALYIRHRGPGLVLTYFNPGWVTDARHECTHALLDASGVKVPQWLDEGLAEYFETASTNPLKHATHGAAVQSQIRYGQVADIQQLEHTDSNTALTAKDYRDAWSVTAFALNSSDQTRSIFQKYLQDLQSERAAGLLSHRLQPAVRSWREDFTQFFRR